MMCRLIKENKTDKICRLCPIVEHIKNTQTCESYMQGFRKNNYS